MGCPEKYPPLALCRPVGIPDQMGGIAGGSTGVPYYRPTGGVVTDPGAFGTWATERYCLYAQSSRGVLYRGEIQHPRWPLQRAELELEMNRYADLKLGERHADVWFSSRVDVVAWPLEVL